MRSLMFSLMLSGVVAELVAGRGSVEAWAEVSWTKKGKKKLESKRVVAK